MTDMLIAGSGPAGASLAILLGRAGFSVELHERAAFPREKPCGEGLMPAGVAALSRLTVSVEGAPFRGIRYHYGSLMAEGRFPATPGLPGCGLGVRRLQLDQILFQAAAATTGVRAFESSTVEEPLLRNGAVCGARVNGQARSARLLIAADGAHSRLRRQLGLDGSPGKARLGLRTHFRLSSGVAAPDWVEVYLGRRHEVYVTPLPHGELQVALLAWRDWVPNSPRTALRTAVVAHPALTALLEGATQVSEIKGLCPLSGNARARVVPGCVLLGDAAGFLDPITGGGMTQALLASELLSRHLQARFSSRLEDLLTYDRARQRLLADYRRLTAMALSVAGVAALLPLWLRLFRACPALFSHMIGVSGGVRRLLPGVPV